jgi:Mobilization protein NikA
VGRPPSLGPNIQFRLPIADHDLVAARAEARGMTVNEYLRARILDSLHRPTSTPTAPLDRRQVTPQWKKGGKQPA